MRRGVGLANQPAEPAGGPTRVRMIELTREYRAMREELLAACARVFDRMQLFGGEELRAFEAEMATFLGAHHVKGVASGTDAIRLAARAAGIGPGDEVVLQANAFVAAVEALVDIGARPVPVDVRLDDLGPDPDALARAIGPRTRGILVVHLYGLPVDMTPVLALARGHGLVVLEDCSHAHGATLDGRCVGTFGTAGAFSLGVVKNLAAYGDAGIVSTNDSAIADQVGLLGTHGQARKNTHVVYGANSRLDELHAAMLRVKLRSLAARNARRATIAAWYSERLAGHVVVPVVDARRTHVYHQYVIRTPEREALRRHLAAAGVETGLHYPVPIHRQPAWRDRFGEGPHLPRVERAVGEILSLPVHPDLGDAEVEHVAASVASFFS
jgi:dTDP-4-amino-4,6-dideoxygalactose transaminase